MREAAFVASFCPCKRTPCALPCHPLNVAALPWFPALHVLHASSILEEDSSHAAAATCTLTLLATAQEVELEAFATRYVGQAIGGGERWRGKLSAETDSRGQKVYRATRKVVVPPGLAFYSVYRYSLLNGSPALGSFSGPITYVSIVRYIPPPGRG